MSRFAFTGRLVQGDVTKGYPQFSGKGATRQPKMKSDGSGQLHQWFGALAIPKDPSKRLIIPGQPTYEQEKAKLDADARAAWPQFFSGQRAPNLNYALSLPDGCTKPDFANKIIDGDSFDGDGQPYSAMEGWGGCWVIKCSNGFAPKLYEWTANGWQETLHTGRTIKCGDYVTLSGDSKSNESSDSPGMYMNFDTVSFEQEGQFIASSNTVDPNTALGTRGGVTTTAPNGQQQGNAGAGSTGGPAHGTQGSGTASGYSGYRETASAEAPPPPADAPAPPPAGPTMTAAATTTYEKYRAAGWTDDQLRASGLMV